jgi:hypothetical protein
MMKTIIVAMCLAVTAALAQTNEVPKIAYADVTFDAEMQKELRSIATRAYAEASEFGLTSMDSTIIKGGFVLANDEDGLGKSGDRIAEVQIRIFTGEKTRGLVLVNAENKTAHVVFPRKKDNAVKGDSSITLASLLRVDASSSDTPQHPLVCGEGRDFPVGREFAFRHAQSREFVHAVVPESVEPPKTFNGKFVLHGRYQGIQNRNIYTLKRPPADYQYFVVTSWKQED